MENKLQGLLSHCSDPLPSIDPQGENAACPSGAYATSYSDSLISYVMDTASSVSPHQSGAGRLQNEADITREEDFAHAVTDSYSEPSNLTTLTSWASTLFPGASASWAPPSSGPPRSPSLRRYDEWPLASALVFNRLSSADSANCAQGHGVPRLLASPGLLPRRSSIAVSLGDLGDTGSPYFVTKSTSLPDLIRYNDDDEESGAHPLQEEDDFDMELVNKFSSVPPSYIRNSICVTTSLGVYHADVSTRRYKTDTPPRTVSHGSARCEVFGSNDSSSASPPGDFLPDVTVMRAAPFDNALSVSAATTGEIAESITLESLSARCVAVSQDTLPGQVQGRCAAYTSNNSVPMSDGKPPLSPPSFGVPPTVSPPPVFLYAADGDRGVCEDSSHSDGKETVVSAVTSVDRTDPCRSFTSYSPVANGRCQHYAQTPRDEKRHELLSVSFQDGDWRNLSYMHPYCGRVLSMFPAREYPIPYLTTSRLYPAHCPVYHGPYYAAAEGSPLTPVSFPLRPTIGTKSKPRFPLCADGSWQPLLDDSNRTVEAVGYSSSHTELPPSAVRHPSVLPTSHLMSPALDDDGKNYFTVPAYGIHKPTILVSPNMYCDSFLNPISLLHQTLKDVGVQLSHESMHSSAIPSNALVPALLDIIPKDPNGQLLSVGSIHHHIGFCRACLFLTHPVKQCRNGVQCLFCHFPHTPKPRSKLSKRKRLQRKRQLQAALSLSSQPPIAL